MKDLENRVNLITQQKTPVQYLQVAGKRIISQKQIWLYGALGLGLFFMKYHEKGFWYSFCASLAFGGFLYFLYFFGEVWNFIKTRRISRGKLIVHSIIFCLVLLASILLLSWQNIAEMLGISMGLVMLYYLVQSKIQKFKKR